MHDSGDTPARAGADTLAAMAIVAHRQVILTGMTHRVGPKGQVVIPKDLRDRLGIVPGSEVVFAATADGVLVAPAGGFASLRGTLTGLGLRDELARVRAAEQDAEDARW